MNDYTNLNRKDYVALLLAYATIPLVAFYVIFLAIYPMATIILTALGFAVWTVYQRGNLRDLPKAPGFGE